MRAAHTRIRGALSELAALDRKAEPEMTSDPVAEWDIAQAIQRLKSQKLDVLNEIRHLRKVRKHLCLQIIDQYNTASTCFMHNP